MKPAQQSKEALSLLLCWKGKDTNLQCSQHPPWFGHSSSFSICLHHIMPLGSYCLYWERHSHECQRSIGFCVTIARDSRWNRRYLFRLLSHRISHTLQRASLTRSICWRQSTVWPVMQSSTTWAHQQCQPMQSLQTSIASLPEEPERVRSAVYSPQLHQESGCLMQKRLSNHSTTQAQLAKLSQASTLLPSSLLSAEERYSLVTYSQVIQTFPPDCIKGMLISQTFVGMCNQKWNFEMSAMFISIIKSDKK